MLKKFSIVGGILGMLTGIAVQTHMTIRMMGLDDPYIYNVTALVQLIFVSLMFVSFIMEIIAGRCPLIAQGKTGERGPMGPRGHAGPAGPEGPRGKTSSFSGTGWN